MPILPVLGYKPITSYFSPAPSTKRKRKEATHIVNETKRPRPSPSSTSGETILAEKSRTENPLHGGHKGSHGRSSTEMLGPPQTPLTNLHGRKKLESVLPTPPTTAFAPSRRKTSRKEEAVSSNGLQASAIDLTIPSAFMPRIPPPKIPPLSTEATFLDQVNAEDYAIPSSQSQSIGEHGDLGFTLDSRPATMKKSSWNDHHIRKLVPNNQLVIESSQSQYLIIESPKKQEKEPGMWSPFSTIDLIPSSQSQEEELIPPCKVTNECEDREDDTSILGTTIGRRTFSEQLFSVPIQDSILRNIFPDEEVEDSLVLNPLVPTVHSSVVESRTEEECEEPASLGMGRNASFSTSLHPFPATQDSSASQSTLEVGSYSSLPSAVWEFKEMFGNGDESYPPDFPESLRS